MSKNKLEQKNKKSAAIPVLATLTGVLGASTIGLGIALAIKKPTPPEPVVTDNIEAGNIDVSIIGNNMVAYMSFTLKEKLGEGMTLTYETATVEKKTFSFQPLVVTGKAVSLPIYWLNVDSHEEVVWDGSIQFKCKNTATDQTIWSADIEHCKVSYLPYVTIDDEERVKLSTDLDDSRRVLSPKFTFNLPNGTPSGYTTHFEVNIDTSKYKDENTFMVDESDITTEYDEATKSLTVTVPATTKKTEVATGDTLKFDVQISCMFGDTDIPIWISSKFVGLSASYDAYANAVPADYLTVNKINTKYGECWKITGVNIPENEEDEFNTLYVPDMITRDNEQLHVYSIGSETAETPIEMPTSITKIAFEHDSWLTEVDPYAFAGHSHIKYLDISFIDNSASELDTLVFGENAFAGWNEEGGHVIWSEDFSQYKRLLIMGKLYQAGLTTANWYNINNVSTLGDLREACKTGGYVRLNANITIPANTDSDGNIIDYTGQIEITQSLILDLNGHFVTSAEPIYDHDAKEFGIFGIWFGAEVVVTDSSAEHDGAVIAYDQSQPCTIGDKTYAKGLADPELVPPETEEKKYESRLWNYAETEKRPGYSKWKPREARTFYVRTDTPSKAETSLWITAGKYYGNCTTIMTWNGPVWIEEGYKEDKDTTHKFAPEFHIFTPRRDYNNANGEVYTKGAGELVNCDNGNMATGDARFEIYGGKFYGFDYNGDGPVPEDAYLVYDPRKAIRDPSESDPANWLATPETRDKYDVVLLEDALDPVFKFYNLVYRKEQP